MKWKKGRLTEKQNFIGLSLFLFSIQKVKCYFKKREFHKYHSPGLWSNTACTHPRPNESNDIAALRRLKEEMGITQVKITKIFDFVYKEKLDNDLTEYEFDHVFVGVSDALPVPESSEVSEFEYVDTTTLLARIKSNPEQYTVWFKKVIERVISEYQKMKQ